jgi:hypothetical protein
MGFVVSEVKRGGGAAVAALIAHVWAWIVGLWLAFGPAYQGVKAVAPGEPTAEVTLTATYIEVNGLPGLMVVLVPLLLTALSLLVILSTNPGTAARRLLLWVAAVVALGLCALGYLSFGILYLPVALALIVAALLDLFRQPGMTERPE